MTGHHVTIISLKQLARPLVKAEPRITPAMARNIRVMVARGQAEAELLEVYGLSRRGLERVRIGLA